MERLHRSRGARVPLQGHCWALVVSAREVTTALGVTVEPVHWEESIAVPAHLPLLLS